MPDYENGQLSDEEIVDLTLRDQEAFAFIAKRYKQKLFNYVMRLTNIRAEDAEDLLQEIFLKTYLNLNDFDRDMKFSSWIYAIARNQVISNHRKLQVRAEGHSVTIDDERALQIAAEFDIKKIIDLKILKDRIDQAMDKLKQKHKEILILKFYEEKSYEEISDIIKKPIGTVGSMMNAAKKELKKELIK